MNPMRLLALLIATLISSTSLAHDTENKADPDETGKALSSLLASSSETIGPGSSCYAAYGQQGQPAIKDLLAVQLASLYKGQNSITGHCTGNRCELSIRHAAGEDVSAADIRYSTSNGAAVASTLECFMTP